MFESVAIAHDTRFDHFTHQVVSFAGTFSYSGKYRQTAITFRDIINKLLDKNGFAYPCTSEKADFTTFSVRFDQVDYFDASEQNFRGSTQVFKQRRLIVDRTAIGFINSWQPVNRVSRHIKQPSPDPFANRHGYRLAGIVNFHSANQAFSTIHSYTTYAIFSKMLLHFQYQRIAVIS